jgi:hypothetical protein
MVARWVSGYPGTSSVTPEGALPCARHEEGKTMRLARLRYAAVAALVIATVVNAGGSAYAAAPSNDTYSGRVVVGALPYSATVDTTEATTDADDAELNANCGAPATDASVWYQLTAPTDGGLVADMSTSSYPAGAIVATGGPGAWNVVACAPGAVGWSAIAGETYTILVFDDQSDGAGNGGTLNLRIEVAPPPPSIDVTVDPTARFTRTGSAIVTGTVICDSTAVFAFLDTELSQTVGRFVVRGFSTTDITCDGTTRPWSVEIIADNGTFAGGKAASVTFAVACGTFECGVDFEERVVRLTGQKG